MINHTLPHGYANKQQYPLAQWLETPQRTQPDSTYHTDIVSNIHQNKPNKSPQIPTGRLAGSPSGKISGNRGDALSLITRNYSV